MGNCSGGDWNFHKSISKSRTRRGRLKKVFVLVSSLFAIREETPQVPNALYDEKELIAQIREIDSRHHLLEMLRAIRIAVDDLLEVCNDIIN